MVETYKKEILVTEPETDITKRMTLSNIMLHSQQMGSEHIASMGIDYNRMYRDGMVFLVNKMLITIDRRPVFGEELLLTTIPRKPKGAQFIRDTIFETRAGEKLIEVSISWMLVSPDTHKILRPSVFDVYGFEMFPNEGEYITGYRIRRPEAETVTHLRQVKYSDLDYNFHVNNAVYAAIVCDTLPLEPLTEREIASFGIVYQREAKAGEVIELDVAALPDAAYYVGGRVAEERCFEAEIKFR